MVNAPFSYPPPEKNQKTYEFFEDFLKTWNHVVKLELALIRRLTISEFNESQASSYIFWVINLQFAVMTSLNLYEIERAILN